MFARLGRLFRAWMGYFISVGENPEVMLQDAIEEMRMTMPKLNSVLVATRATVIRLEEEHEGLQRHRQHEAAQQPAVAQQAPPESGHGGRLAIEHVEPLAHRHQREHFGAHDLQRDAVAQAPCEPAEGDEQAEPVRRQPRRAGDEEPRVLLCRL